MYTYRDTINKVSFVVCLICLAIGILLALIGIWGEVEREIYWKLTETTSVLFVFSLLTTVVNRLMPR
jgi:hypothetical protein